MSLSLNAVYSFSWIKLDFLVTSHPPCCSCSVYAQELMYDMKLFNKITASFFHHYQNMSIVEWHSNCPVAVVGLHFDIISKQGMKLSSSFWFYRYTVLDNLVRIHNLYGIWKTVIWDTRYFEWNIRRQ